MLFFIKSVSVTDNENLVIEFIDVNNNSVTKIIRKETLIFNFNSLEDLLDNDLFKEATVTIGGTALVWDNIKNKIYVSHKDLFNCGIRKCEMFSNYETNLETVVEVNKLKVRDVKTIIETIQSKDYTELRSKIKYIILYGSALEVDCKESDDIDICWITDIDENEFMTLVSRFTLAAKHNGVTSSIDDYSVYKNIEDIKNEIDMYRGLGYDLFRQEKIIKGHIVFRGE